ncbi:hypothetical protein [Kribbella sp. NPDC004875]|uniref:hypothetical protein n=1 Tax=Kribbella sp. NPDC004875 TaxID=3364107 RepID=UPI0036770D31
MSKPWRIGGAIYVLGVLAFATYVYFVDFDLIRFLWLASAPCGLAVPAISYLVSIPPILLGLADPVDGWSLVPLVLALWTAAALTNILIAHTIWTHLHTHCPRRTQTTPASAR